MCHSCKPSKRFSGVPPNRTRPSEGVEQLIGIALKRRGPAATAGLRSFSGGKCPAPYYIAIGFAVRCDRSTLLKTIFGARKPRLLLFPHLLSCCFAPSFPAATPPPSRGGQGIAIDGKAHRGRLAFTAGAAGCPVHMLSAVSHDDGLVLTQAPITATGDKAQGELTVAPALIARLDWRGRVLTGDALFCQRKLCEQVLKAGGDYLIIVKENQPTLYDDLRLLFDSPYPTFPLTDRREAQSWDNGHGRHEEVRRLVASTDLVGYSDWPGLVQAFRWERQWREHGPKPPEVRYGITSLPPQYADAARLLELKRGHWCIENGLHYVKDVTMGEDRSLIHDQEGPNVIAMLRDAALNLLRWTGQQAIARRLRYHSSHPKVAVSLVRGQNA